MTNASLQTFMTLRETPLHKLRGAEWIDYYATLHPYLFDENSDIREMAVERLMMAVFRAEPFSGAHDAKVRRDRVADFIAVIERAHASHSDILPHALRNFRWHGDDHDFPSLLMPWFDQLLRDTPNGCSSDLITGARLLIGSASSENVRESLIGALDSPSDWVRGCAAHRLAETVDTQNAIALRDDIAQREIMRPGVAGPFGAAYGVSDDEDLWRDVGGLAAWMMDLLERRCGPAPHDMPFNDIEFHLHELCSTSPAYVRRMIDKGFFALALMTALEDADHFATMKPFIEELSNASDPEIAAFAKKRLANAQ